MEVNKISVVCLVLVCVAFNSVQSASFYYRTGRELEVPVENEIIREEIIAELKKEPEVTAAEPIAVILEIPVAQLIKEAPAAEVQEPVAIISEKVESNAVNEETIALRSAGAETNIPVVVEEKIVSAPIVEEPVAVAAVEDDIPKTRNEPIIEVVEKLADPVAEVQTEDKVAPAEVVYVAVKSNPIEEEAAVVEKENVVPADAPVAEKDEAVRQSEGDATTARPNVIQAITSQIQNFQTQFQNQIQSVFNPNAANAASTSANTDDSTVSSTARPTFIAQFQQAVGQVFNRPAGSTGPIQGLVSAVQTNFQTAQTNLQGLFRPGSATTAPTTVPIVVAPVDPVVGEKTMLGEVPVVNEPAAVVEKVEEKETEVKSD